MVACLRPRPFNLSVLPPAVTWSGNFTPLISAADALPTVNVSAKTLIKVTFRVIIVNLRICEQPTLERKSSAVREHSLRSKACDHSVRLCPGPERREPWRRRALLGLVLLPVLHQHCRKV